MDIVYVNGAYYGKVMDNSDPNNLGRVKVLIDVSGDSIETKWAPVISFYGGEEKGAFYLPEVDDQVIVVFLDNTINNPIIISNIWGDNQKPPETEENTGCDLNQDGDNLLKFIRSRAGHRIILDDKDGEEKVQFVSGDGNTRVEFLKKDKMINIETDKDVSINADGKLGIEADEIILKLDKDVIIETDELSFETKTKDINNKSNSNMKIEGASLILN